MPDRYAPSIVLDVHPAQLAFVNSAALYTGFYGGRGSGKSSALALKLYKRAMQEPGLYGMYSSTFPLLSDTIQRTFLTLAKPHIRKFNQSRNVVHMWSGAEILCRSLDDPENARGPSLRGAVWDEASLTHDTTAFDILIGCLRYQGKQGWLAAAFTPKGPRHWTTEKFINAAGTDSAAFHATTDDNPFLPPGFAATLRGQYTTAYAQQEIEGRVVALGGTLMRREWFRVVTDSPQLVAQVRYWDMAATVAEEGKDPDWTAGARVGRTADGRWVVLDMRHARLSPAGNEMLVQATAAEDGRGVPVVMEEEGGASGKSLVDHYRRGVLVGHAFRGDRPTGDKVVRAQPLAAAAEQGNVLLMRGAWNRDFLDEVEAFGPDCAHDDQVDAVSGAVNAIAPRYIHPSVGFAQTPGERLSDLDRQVREALEELPEAERKVLEAQLV